jgi:hypothetical protein
MSKSHTMKSKVVFITHSRSADVTTELKAANPLRAAHINREVMNAKTKTKKCSNLAGNDWESDQSRNNSHI